MLPRPRTFATLALATTLMLGATACTGSPQADDATPEATNSADSSQATTPSPDAEGDNGQSTAEACLLVQDTITAATDEFDNVSQEDPTAVVDALQAAADQLGAIEGDVTNDAVAALVPTLQAQLREVGETMGEILAGNIDSMDDLEELGTSFQETTAEFEKICAL
ncbi:hypothetical protein ACWPKO_24725 (plasmid) [Coraliomargarita sp. W4R53]